MVQYEPFGTAVATDSMAITIHSSGDLQACNLGLSIFGLAPGADRQASLNNSKLLYRIYLDGNLIVNDPDAITPVALAVSGDADIHVKIEVPAGQIAPAGIYSDPVTIKLVDRDAANRSIGTDAQAVVSVAMASRAQANIAGSSIDPTNAFGFARLDFGDLRQNATKRVLLQVRSTADVGITVTSAEGGVLRREQGRGEALPYRLTVDGVEVRLDGSPGPIQRPPSPTQLGASYPIEATVAGDPDVLPAGAYEDTLTIDVLPL
jgi:spore coat protein U-like protein